MDNFYIHGPLDRLVYTCIYICMYACMYECMHYMCIYTNNLRTRKRSETCAGASSNCFLILHADFGLDKKNVSKTMYTWLVDVGGASRIELFFNLSPVSVWDGNLATSGSASESKRPWRLISCGLEGRIVPRSVWWFLHVLAQRCLWTSLMSFKLIWFKLNGPRINDLINFQKACIAWLCLGIFGHAGVILCGCQLWITKLCTSSSTAQGGGGSFKNRKTIGEVGCCESPLMDRQVVEVSSLSLSFFLFFWLPTYVSIYVSIYLSLSLCLSIDRSICLSISLSLYPSIPLSIYLSVYLSICLSVYLSISIYLSLSVCLSAYLSICKIENEAILRDFLSFWAWQHQKRSNSARLPQFLHLTTSKTKQFCETSSFFQVDNIKNETILRDFLQKWKVECRAGGLVPVRFAIFPVHLSKVLRLPRKRDARSYEVLHLSRKTISANLKIWCSPSHEISARTS